jgi:hypothetical protein
MQICSKLEQKNQNDSNGINRTLAVHCITILFAQPSTQKRTSYSIAEVKCIYGNRVEEEGSSLLLSDAQSECISF